jgi:hemerythrin-like metal-binding protein
MFEFMTEKKSQEEIKPLLDGLKSYTVTHFNNEERLFDKYGYPGTEAHKKEHSDFVAKVEDFYKGFNSGDLMLTMDVMNFLKSWLKTHITGTDKKYKDFLNSKGEF